MACLQSLKQYNYSVFLNILNNIRLRGKGMTKTSNSSSTDICQVLSESVTALLGCERSGRTSPPKIHQKVVPLRKILLYFFIVALGRRWHV